MTNAPLIFPIVNAAGGVYYRNSPHWSDTSGPAGGGVYDEDEVQLICGSFGDAVGGHANTAWSYVTNLSRRIGSGWVNKHFIDDGAVPGHLVAGEPMCGSNGPGTPAGRGTPGSPSPGAPAVTSVFFSPNPDPEGVVDLTQPIATTDLGLNKWASAGCKPDLAVKALPSGTNTLAGWSSGRLGPTYILQAGSPAQRALIHRIILFDPGNTSWFTSSPWPFHVFHSRARCDLAYNINGLIANFLGSDSDNRLLILTGQESEMKTAGDYGRPSFAGLWKYYLADLWNKSFGWQALVCDYDGLRHGRLLHDFATVVNHPVSGPKCPTHPDDPAPLQWNP